MTDTRPSDHDRALRVAIVGAGPSGFYAALELLGSDETGPLRVDMFDRLPAPYGLVRYGVAPDHQKIKTVVRVFERGAEAARTRFRFNGNVELGTDVTLDELRARYHAVILSFGAQEDRRLGIPGEDLPGVYAAREFVAWYNGHPDFIDHQFDLSGQRAVVVGIGNVAIDVARILSRTPAELAVTDIYEGALEVLARSNIREVLVLARRGPAQAACTPTELRELSRMERADLAVGEADLDLDPHTQRRLDDGQLDRRQLKNLELMRNDALREPRAGRKVIRLRFYVSPIEILGDEAMTGVRLRRNRLEPREGSDRLSVVPTEETEDIAASTLFRSIGYRVTPVPGVPYDTERALIPHAAGQVLTLDGSPEPGLFVTGWAKRGPSGVIGTNKPDAAETVQTVLSAAQDGRLPALEADEDIRTLLAERGVRYVRFDDWRVLDKLEIEAGEVQGRPRRKMTDVEAMLRALEEARAVEGDGADEGEG